MGLFENQAEKTTKRPKNFGGFLLEQLHDPDDIAN